MMTTAAAMAAARQPVFPALFPDAVDRLSAAGAESASTCDPQLGHSPDVPRMVNGVSQDGHLTNFTIP